MCNIGKLFSVLVIFLCVSNVVQAADPWPRFGVAGIGDGPNTFLVSGASYTWAGLNPDEFYGAYMFDFAGGDDNFGYVVMNGGDRWVEINILENTLNGAMGFNAGISDLNGGHFRNLIVASETTVYDGASIQSFEFTHPNGQASFMGYLISGGPVVADVTLTLVSDGFTRYVGDFDAGVGGHMLYEVKVGDLIMSPIPEPSTYAMILIGLFFLSLWSRRQMRYDPGKIIF